MLTTLAAAICLPTFYVRAAPNSAPSSPLPGYEPYSVRPNALKLKPRGHADLGGNWAKIKRGHLEAVAMLLEMYPDREICFLARDSELLFDLAREVTRGHPDRQARLHLLNISRANMRDPHLKDYLAQEGISEATLEAGKKVLFVDTGHNGTISRVITEQFPPAFASQLQTQLMLSDNPAHPSCRTFLSVFNPAAALLSPSSLHGSILSFEHMPHFTDRSDRFARVGNHWEPMSRVGGETEGLVSQEEAQLYQEDMLEYARTEETKQLLTKRRGQWKALKALSQASELTAEMLEAELKAMLRTAVAQDPFVAASVRDFLDLRATNLPGGPPQVTPQVLGLTRDIWSSGGSNKNELIQMYPEWASVLEHPYAEIPKLLQSDEWGKLGAMIDVVKDIEFTRALTQSLGTVASPAKAIKPFIKLLIEKGDAQLLQELAVNTFSQPHAAEMKDLLRLVIEKGDARTLHKLALYTFSQPHTAEMKDLLRLVIEKADVGTLRTLSTSTFSTPFWNTPENSVFKQSLSFADSIQRRQFLNQKLGAIAEKARPESTATCLSETLQAMRAGIEK
jgi:hypothetical protein